jgi:DNA-directed RNA polymerase subunit beta'
LFAHFKEFKICFLEYAEFFSVNAIIGDNVIVGHKIPAGTGLREYDHLFVASREEYQRMSEASRNVTDIDDITDGIN